MTWTGVVLLAQELELIAQKLSAVVRGLAIQDELGDIGQGDGVAARNAPEGDHLGEVAEEAIDRGRVAEVGDGGEEFGGSGLSGALAIAEAAGVEGAEAFGGNVQRRNLRQEPRDLAS